MTHETDQHPAKEQLQAYGRGKLDLPQASEIEQHLEQCPQCCDTMVNLEDDTFIGLVRQATPPREADPEASSPQLAPAQQAASEATLGLAAESAGKAGDLNQLPPELVEHPRYEIIKRIGRGGMGDVYLAQHRVMNRLVALKVIKPELVQHEEAVQRFRREVQAAARLQHKNIVTAYDAEQAGDLHFLVMEYADGVSLDEFVRRRGAMPVDQACQCICLAAAALQYAHELGMVHRDIKPHNLMLTRTGEVKILDFGLANFVTEAAAGELEEASRTDESQLDFQSPQLTRSGSMMGTPDFIAPEQALDAHTADIRADIYSLGCTFYTLLAGKAPFGEGSVVEKIKAHSKLRVPPLAELRSDVPAEVEGVMQKMMAKLANGRYHQPREIAEALASHAQATSRSAPATPPPPSLFQRLPWLFVALGTLVIAGMLSMLIAMGIIFYYMTDKGVVMVEVADQSLQVQLDHQRITLSDGQTPISIRPGEETLTVRRGDFEFETDSFQLRRGEEVAFKVELLPGEIVVSKDGLPFDTTSLPEKLAGNSGIKQSPPAIPVPSGAMSATDQFVEITRLNGHQGPIKSLDLSPDASRAVTASGWPQGDGTLRLWDTSSGRQIHLLGAYGEQMLACAYSPTGELVAGGDMSGIANLWDTTTGTKRFELKAHLGGIESMTFSPDGNTLLSTGIRGAREDQQGEARLWDTQTGKLLWKYESDGWLMCGDFFPDGQRIVVGGFQAAGNPYLLDATTGKLLDRYHQPYEGLHDMEDLAIAPDGKSLAGVTSIGDLWVWNIQSGERSAHRRVDDQRLFSVAYSPHGKYLYCGGHSAVIHGLNATTLKSIASKEQASGTVWDLAVSRDGKQLLTAGGATFAEGSPQPNDDYAARLWQLPPSVWPDRSSQRENRLSERVGELNAARQASAAWLKVLDAGEFQQAAELADSRNEQQTLETLLRSSREDLGKVIKRKEESIMHSRFVQFRCRTQFEHDTEAIEMIMVAPNHQGKWHVLSYALRKQ